MLLEMSNGGQKVTEINRNRFRPQSSRGVNSINNFFVLLMALLSVTLVSYRYIYFSIFPAIILLFLRSNGRLGIYRDTILNIFLFLFILWSVLDTVFGSKYLGYSFTSRNVIQALYNFTYLFLIFNYKKYVKKFNDYMVIIGLIYSMVIIFLFFVSGTFLHLEELYGSYRLWIDKYLSVSVTAGPVPLIYTLFVMFLNKDRLYKRMIISMATVLFPSRVSLLGVIIVWIYFYWVNKSKNLRWVFLVIGIIALVNFDNIIEWVNIVAPTLGYRLTVIWDREQISDVVFGLFKIHPLIGYGGNSIDQIYFLGDYVSFTDTNWFQTHNFVYEFLIRYGLIGLALFLIFLIRYIVMIKNRHCRFMILLFTGMGLFQIYFRGFYFILLMSMIFNLSLILTEDSKNDFPGMRTKN